MLDRLNIKYQRTIYRAFITCNRQLEIAFYLSKVLKLLQVFTILLFNNLIILLVITFFTYNRGLH